MSNIDTAADWQLDIAHLDTIAAAMVAWPESHRETRPVVTWDALVALVRTARAGLMLRGNVTGAIEAASEGAADPSAHPVHREMSRQFGLALRMVLTGASPSDQHAPHNPHREPDGGGE